jgi:inosine-uridine nucleoside N-ribohydrolase
MRETLSRWLGASLPTAILCALTLLAWAPGATAQEHVIVDADMGVLNDDAVALFMLLNTANVRVLGVTIVPGNTWAENGTAYALRQLELVGRTDVPVFMGVREPLMGDRRAWLEAEERLWGHSEYLGAYARPRPASYLALEREPAIGYPASSKPSDEHAVDFIVRTVKAHPNQVTIFALGPPTNIALAIRKNPEIVPLVKRIVYMGGAVDVPGNATPAAEFNWWFDPESTRITLRAPFPEQIVVPLDIAERVFYTKTEYDRIVAGPETPITRLFKQLHGPRFEKDPAARSFVWDALATAIVLQPAIATQLHDRFLDIDVIYGPNYGRSIGYHESRRRSFANPADFPAGTQKVKVLFDIDRQAFWNLYVELMRKSPVGLPKAELPTEHKFQCQLPILTSSGLG